MLANSEDNKSDLILPSSSPFSVLSSSSSGFSPPCTSVVSSASLPSSTSPPCFFPPATLCPLLRSSSEVTGGEKEENSEKEIGEKVGGRNEEKEGEYTPSEDSDAQLKGKFTENRKDEMERVVVVGILAIQGDFLSHQKLLHKLALKNFSFIQVRKSSELDECDGLILPGGESTSIKISLMENNQQNLSNNPDYTLLLARLRKFILEDKKPVWGTCAGCILLAEKIFEEKEKSKVLTPNVLGGMNIEVHRNFFGRQKSSFESDFICANSKLQEYLKDPLRVVCIRAPAILSLLSPHVEVLGYTYHNGQQIIAGVREGSMMATIFHPELTDNLAMHRFFLHEIVLPSLQNKQNKI